MIKQRVVPMRLAAVANLHHCHDTRRLCAKQRTYSFAVDSERDLECTLSVVSNTSATFGGGERVKRKYSQPGPE